MIVPLISGGFAIVAGIYAFVKQHYRDPEARTRVTLAGVVLIALVAVSAVVFFQYWRSRSGIWIAIGACLVGTPSLGGLAGWFEAVIGHKLEAGGEEQTGRPPE
jgi:hypothetical protein